MIKALKNNWVLLGILAVAFFLFLSNSNFLKAQPQALILQDSANQFISYSRPGYSNPVSSGDFSADVDLKYLCMDKLKADFNVYMANNNLQLGDEIDHIEDDSFNPASPCWNVTILGKRVTAYNVPVGDGTFSFELNNVQAFAIYGMRSFSKSKTEQVRSDVQTVDTMGRDPETGEQIVIGTKEAYSETTVRVACNSADCLSSGTEWLTTVYQGVYPFSTMNTDPLTSDNGKWTAVGKFNLVNKDIIKGVVGPSNINILQASLVDYALPVQNSYTKRLDGFVYVKYLIDDKFYGHETFRDLDLVPGIVKYPIPLLTRTPASYEVDNVPALVLKHAGVEYVYLQDKPVLLEYIISSDAPAGLRVREADWSSASYKAEQLNEFTSNYGNILTDAVNASKCTDCVSRSEFEDKLAAQSQPIPVPVKESGFSWATVVISVLLAMGVILAYHFIVKRKKK